MKSHSGFGSVAASDAAAAGLPFPARVPEPVFLRLNKPESFMPTWLLDTPARRSLTLMPAAAPDKPLDILPEMPLVFSAMLLHRFAGFRMPAKLLDLNRLPGPGLDVDADSLACCCVLCSPLSAAKGLTAVEPNRGGVAGAMSAVLLFWSSNLLPKNSCAADFLLCP